MGVVGVLLEAPIITSADKAFGEALGPPEAGLVNGTAEVVVVKGSEVVVDGIIVGGGGVVVGIAVVILGCGCSVDKRVVKNTGKKVVSKGLAVVDVLGKDVVIGAAVAADDDIERGSGVVNEA